MMREAPQNGGVAAERIANLKENSNAKFAEFKDELAAVHLVCNGLREQICELRKAMRKQEQRFYILMAVIGTAIAIYSGSPLAILKFLA